MLPRPPQAYDSALEHCLHGPGCKQGAACTIGRRLTRVTVLSGSVVRVWGTLEAVLAKHDLQVGGGAWWLSRSIDLPGSI